METKTLLKIVSFLKEKEELMDIRTADELKEYLHKNGITVNTYDELNKIKDCYNEVENYLCGDGVLTMDLLNTVAGGTPEARDALSRRVKRFSNGEMKTLNFAVEKGTGASVALLDGKVPLNYNGDHAGGVDPQKYVEQFGHVPNDMTEQQPRSVEVPSGKPLSTDVHHYQDQNSMRDMREVHLNDTPSRQSSHEQRQPNRAIHLGMSEGHGINPSSAPSQQVPHNFDEQVRQMPAASGHSSNDVSIVEHQQGVDRPLVQQSHANVPHIYAMRENVSVEDLQHIQSHLTNDSDKLEALGAFHQISHLGDHDAQPRQILDSIVASPDFLTAFENAAHKVAGDRRIETKMASNLCDMLRQYMNLSEEEKSQLGETAQTGLVNAIKAFATYSAISVDTDKTEIMNKLDMLGMVQELISKDVPRISDLSSSDASAKEFGMELVDKRREIIERAKKEREEKKQAAQTQRIKARIKIEKQRMEEARSKATVVVEESRSEAAVKETEPKKEESLVEGISGATAVIEEPEIKVNEAESEHVLVSEEPKPTVVEESKPKAAVKEIEVTGAKTNKSTTKDASETAVARETPKVEEDRGKFTKLVVTEQIKPIELTDEFDGKVIITYDSSTPVNVSRNRKKKARKKAREITELIQTQEEERAIESNYQEQQKKWNQQAQEVKNRIAMLQERYGKYWLLHVDDKISEMTSSQIRSKEHGEKYEQERNDAPQEVRPPKAPSPEEEQRAKEEAVLRDTVDSYELQKQVEKEAEIREVNARESASKLIDYVMELHEGKYDDQVGYYIDFNEENFATSLNAYFHILSELDPEAYGKLIGYHRFFGDVKQDRQEVEGIIPGFDERVATIKDEYNQFSKISLIMTMLDGLGVLKDKPDDFTFMQDKNGKTSCFIPREFIDKLVNQEGINHPVIEQVYDLISGSLDGRIALENMDKLVSENPQYMSLIEKIAANCTVDSKDFGGTSGFEIKTEAEACRLYLVRCDYNRFIDSFSRGEQVSKDQMQSFVSDAEILFRYVFGADRAGIFDRTRTPEDFNKLFENKDAKDAIVKSIIDVMNSTTSESFNSAFSRLSAEIEVSLLEPGNKPRINVERGVAVTQDELLKLYYIRYGKLPIGERKEDLAKQVDTVHSGDFEKTISSMPKYYKDLYARFFKNIPAGDPYAINVAKARAYVALRDVVEGNRDLNRIIFGDRLPDTEEQSTDANVEQLKNDVKQLKLQLEEKYKRIAELEDRDKDFRRFNELQRREESSLNDTEKEELSSLREKDDKSKLSSLTEDEVSELTRLQGDDPNVMGGEFADLTRQLREKTTLLNKAEKQFKNGKAEREAEKKTTLRKMSELVFSQTHVELSVQNSQIYQQDVRTVSDLVQQFNSTRKTKDAVAIAAAYEKINEEYNKIIAKYRLLSQVKDESAIKLLTDAREAKTEKEILTVDRNLNDLASATETKISDLIATKVSKRDMTKLRNELHSKLREGELNSEISKLFKGKLVLGDSLHIALRLVSRFQLDKEDQVAIAILKAPKEELDEIKEENSFYSLKINIFEILLGKYLPRLSDDVIFDVASSLNVKLGNSDLRKKAESKLSKGDKAQLEIWRETLSHSSEIQAFVREELATKSDTSRGDFYKAINDQLALLNFSLKREPSTNRLVVLSLTDGKDAGLAAWKKLNYEFNYPYGSLRILDEKYNDEYRALAREINGMYESILGEERMKLNRQIDAVGDSKASIDVRIETADHILQKLLELSRESVNIGLEAEKLDQFKSNLEKAVRARGVKLEDQLNKVDKLLEKIPLHPERTLQIIEQGLKDLRNDIKKDIESSKSAFDKASDAIAEAVNGAEKLEESASALQSDEAILDEYRFDFKLEDSVRQTLSVPETREIEVMSKDGKKVIVKTILPDDLEVNAEVHNALTSEYGAIVDEVVGKFVKIINQQGFNFSEQLNAQLLDIREQHETFVELYNETLEKLTGVKTELEELKQNGQLSSEQKENKAKKLKEKAVALVKDLADFKDEIEGKLEEFKKVKEQQRQEWVRLFTSEVVEKVVSEHMKLEEEHVKAIDEAAKKHKLLEKYDEYKTNLDSFKEKIKDASPEDILAITEQIEKILIPNLIEKVRILESVENKNNIVSYIAHIEMEKIIICLADFGNIKDEISQKGISTSLNKQAIKAAARLVKFDPAKDDYRTLEANSTSIELLVRVIKEAANVAGRDPNFLLISHLLTGKTLTEPKAATVLMHLLRLSIERCASDTPAVREFNPNSGLDLSSETHRAFIAKLFGLGDHQEIIENLMKNTDEYEGVVGDKGEQIIKPGKIGETVANLISTELCSWFKTAEDLNFEGEELKGYLFAGVEDVQSGLLDHFPNLRDQLQKEGAELYICCTPEGSKRYVIAKDGRVRFIDLTITNVHKFNDKIAQRKEAGVEFSLFVDGAKSELSILSAGLVTFEGNNYRVITNLSQLKFTARLINEQCDELIKAGRLKDAARVKDIIGKIKELKGRTEEATFLGFRLNVEVNCLLRGRIEVGKESKLADGFDKFIPKLIFGTEKMPKGIDLDSLRQFGSCYFTPTSEWKITDKQVTGMLADTDIVQPELRNHLGYLYELADTMGFKICLHFDKNGHKRYMFVDRVTGKHSKIFEIKNLSELNQQILKCKQDGKSPELLVSLGGNSKEIENQVKVNKELSGKMASLFDGSNGGYELPEYLNGEACYQGIFVEKTHFLTEKALEKAVSYAHENAREVQQPKNIEANRELVYRILRSPNREELKGSLLDKTTRTVKKVIDGKTVEVQEEYYPGSSNTGYWLSIFNSIERTVQLADLLNGQKIRVSSADKFKAVNLKLNEAVENLASDSKELKQFMYAKPKEQTAILLMKQLFGDKTLEEIENETIPTRKNVSIFRNLKAYVISDKIEKAAEGYGSNLDSFDEELKTYSSSIKFQIDEEVNRDLSELFEVSQAKNLREMVDFDELKEFKKVIEDDKKSAEDVEKVVKEVIKCVEKIKVEELRKFTDEKAKDARNQGKKLISRLSQDDTLDKSLISDRLKEIKASCLEEAKSFELINQYVNEFLKQIEVLTTNSIMYKNGDEYYFPKGIRDKDTLKSIENLYRSVLKISKWISKMNIEQVKGREKDEGKVLCILGEGVVGASEKLKNCIKYIIIRLVNSRQEMLTRVSEEDRKKLNVVASVELFIDFIRSGEGDQWVSRDDYKFTLGDDNQLTVKKIRGANLGREYTFKLSGEDYKCIQDELARERQVQQEKRLEEAKEQLEQEKSKNYGLDLRVLDSVMIGKVTVDELSAIAQGHVPERLKLSEQERKDLTELAVKLTNQQNKKAYKEAVAEVLRKIDTGEKLSEGELGWLKNTAVDFCVRAMVSTQFNKQVTESLSLSENKKYEKMFSDPKFKITFPNGNQIPIKTYFDNVSKMNKIERERQINQVLQPFLTRITNKIENLEKIASRGDLDEKDLDNLKIFWRPFVQEAIKKINDFQPKIDFNSEWFKLSQKISRVVAVNEAKQNGGNLTPEQVQLIQAEDQTAKGQAAKFAEQFVLVSERAKLELSKRDYKLLEKQVGEFDKSTSKELKDVYLKKLNGIIETLKTQFGIRTSETNLVVGQKNAGLFGLSRENVTEKVQVLDTNQVFDSEKGALFTADSNTSTAATQALGQNIVNFAKEVVKFRNSLLQETTKTEIEKSGGTFVPATLA